jgi:hypothetical protein
VGAAPGVTLIRNARLHRVHEAGGPKVLSFATALRLVGAQDRSYPVSFVEERSMEAPRECSGLLNDFELTDLAAWR